MGGKKQLSEESLLGMNGTLRLNPNIVKQQQQKNQNVYFSDLSSTMCNVGKKAFYDWLWPQMTVVFFSSPAYGDHSLTLMQI